MPSKGRTGPLFPVLIEFSSMEDARRWYDSDESGELKNLRLEATVSIGLLHGGNFQPLARLGEPANRL